MEARRLGALEAWKLGGMEAWELGGLDAWKVDGLEAYGAWSHVLGRSEQIHHVFIAS